MDSSKKKKKKKNEICSIEPNLGTSGVVTSCEVSDNDIHESIVNYLQGLADQSEIPSGRTIRRECAKKLNVHKSYLKERKDFIKSIVTEYLDSQQHEQMLQGITEADERMENKKRKVAFSGIAVEGEETPTLKSIQKPEIQLKHFTNTENRIITQLINAYATEFGVEISELNRETATERSKSRRKNHSLLWDRICDALPNRTRVAIMFRGTKIMNRMLLLRGCLSPQEMDTLRSLVVSKTCSLLLVTDLADLQNAYDMLHGRKNKGRFSLDERDRLINVIRNHYNIDASVPATELPDTAPWTQVAADMNFERYPLDYLRYWKRFKILLANGSVVVDDDNGEEDEEQEQEEEEEEESADTPGKRPRSERQKQRSVNELLSKAADGSSSSSRQPTRKAATEKRVDVEKRNLYFLQTLQTLEVEDESEVGWSSLEAELKIANASMLWHLLVKKECPPEDPFICTFREKLDYLVEIHSQRVEFLES